MKTLESILKRDGQYESYTFNAKGTWIQCNKCRIRVRLATAYTDDNEEAILCRMCAMRLEGKMMETFSKAYPDLDSRVNALANALEEMLAELLDDYSKDDKERDGLEKRIRKILGG